MSHHLATTDGGLYDRPGQAGRLPKQPASPIGPIRLGCLYCDRNDFDGIDKFPTDWSDIERVQSLEESRREDDSGENVFLWQTHLGVCPHCRAVRET